MPFDTSIPLRDISAPIMSPMQQETLRSHVQQRQWDEADRQKKAQQDQAVQKILSDPENMDPETGTPSTKGIISVGRLLGPEWAAKASHTYAQTLSSLSEQKKRLHDITLSNKKQQVMWTKQLSEDSLGNLVAEMQTNPNQADAFVKVNGRMIDRINELYRNGKAREMGLNEDDREEMLRGLPKNAAELKAAGTKLGDLEKQLEAMMSDQPEAAAPKAEGPTVAPTKPQEDVEAIPLDDIGKGLKQGAEAIPIVKDMQGKVEEALADDGTPQQTVSLKDVAKAPPIEVTGKQPEVNSTSLRNLAKTEETRADAEQKAGRINNAKKLRDQSKAHMTQAKELVREAQADDKQARLSAKDEAQALRFQINQHPLSPAATKFTAEQYLSGDRQAAQGFARNQVAQAQLREEIVKQATAKGMKPAQVASQLAEYNGIVAAERSAGVRTANIGMAVYEADKFADLAVQASNKVGRTKVKSLNDALLAFQRGTGDEDIVALGAATNSFLNAYSRAVGGGVMHVADREHAETMLQNGFSKGQYAAAINQLKREMAAAKEAPGAVRKELREAVTGEGGIDKGIPEPVKPASGVTPFSDVEKEKRYQEWRKKNGY